MMDLNFGFVLVLKGAGRGVRVSVIRDVMDSWARADVRTSLPMKPFAPVRMSFMMLLIDYSLGLLLKN